MGFPTEVRTASEKEKAEVRRDWLGVREDLINRKHAAVEEVDAQS
jgi:hypothetical protein